MLGIEATVSCDLRLLARQWLGPVTAVDVVVRVGDPLRPLPHDPDVKALLRIAVVWNIPVACNRASADFIISSPLLAEVYERRLPDYDGLTALA
jgi:methylglyoxal synthase